jgi:hypothetical protein
VGSINLHTFGYHLKPIKMTNQDKTIVAWGVYYVPSREGKIFAGLKPELVNAYWSQEDANENCRIENMGGTLDELHYGYVVYSMKWIPKGVKVN